ncbi:hypothetical protein BDZ89DRAFT_1125825 [Hymenopellis radicata]|nr:hypothetical protein BDZ89DRAFT_1125825 [Hymenopellis radicata]
MHLEALDDFNKVNTSGFQGTTKDTLHASRPNSSTSSTSSKGEPFHKGGSWKGCKDHAFTQAPENPFLQASKERSAKRLAECEKAGIRVDKDADKDATSGNGGNKRKRFDPAEEKIKTQLKNTTGRDPVHPKKKKKIDTSKPITVICILVPHTAKVHAGEAPRPNKAMYETLGLPENDYIRNLTLHNPGCTSETLDAILKSFSHIKRTSATGDTNEEDHFPFQLCELAAQHAKGAPSKLRPTDRFQSGRASYADLKSAYTRSQPSGMPVTESQLYIYIVLEQKYEDLALFDPNTKPPKEKTSKKRRRSPSPTPPQQESPNTRAAKKKRDEQPKEDSPIPGSPRARSASPVPSGPKCPLPKRQLSQPKEVATLARQMMNTYSPFIAGTRHDSSYGAGGRWSATAMTSVYFKFTSVTGCIDNINRLLTSTDVFAKNPDLAITLLITNEDYLDAFAPFNTEAERIREAPDHPIEDNTSFVNMFRLGSQGIGYVGDVIQQMSSMAVRLSLLPGISQSSYDGLREVLETLGTLAGNIGILMDYFTGNVDGAYWFPTNGFCQFAGLIRFNRTLFFNNVLHGIKDSVFYKGLSGLKALLESEPSITADIVQEHLSVLAGHASDPAQMYITVLGRGAYGFDYLGYIATYLLMKMPVGPHYHAITKVFGDFYLAVAWKLHNYLRFPKHYNQVRPSFVHPDDVKLNLMTGNEEPIDTYLGPCPDGPDETWYLDYLVPDTVRTATFQFRDRRAPPASSSLTVEDPRLQRMADFIRKPARWDAKLEMDLRAAGAIFFPPGATRSEMQHILTTYHCTPQEKRRQKAILMLVYHPDKNSHTNVRQGAIWERLCNLITGAIAHAFQ